jgi:hypothetical protein
MPGPAIAGIPGGGVPGAIPGPGIPCGIPGPGMPGPAIAGIPGGGMPGPGIPGACMPIPPDATSCCACAPGILCSFSHAVQNVVCFLLMGKSGIQNSVNFVVSLRSTCSALLPHWPHTMWSTASTWTYVFQP